jgi:hypothetical protein
MFRTGVNHDGEPVLWMPGKIVSFDAENPETSKGKNKTQFYRVQVAVTYPDKTTAEVGSLLWKPAYDAKDGTMRANYDAGKTIELEVQLDGDYAGRSKINLPGMVKIDLTAGFNLGTADAPVMTAEEVAEAELLASKA